MRIVRKSQLGSCAGVNIHLRPILKRAKSIRIPFGDTYYFLRGDLEQEYGKAEDKKSRAQQDWFWRCAALVHS